ncbi:MAG: hypothetical protein E7445_00730 [Ruminococcaceae bacterium]|nr:hypothetical protein [Oscillospiraceae bacterium]
MLPKEERQNCRSSFLQKGRRGKNLIIRRAFLDTSYQKGQKQQIILIKFGERDEVLKCAELSLRIVSESYIILWRLVCEKMSNQ